MKKSLWKKTEVLKKCVAMVCCAGLILGLAGCAGTQTVATLTDDEITNGLSFAKYDGPVMPLSVKEDETEAAKNLTVTRDISLDVTSQDDGWGNITEVTDQYVLTNPSEEPVTVTLCYPFVCSFYVSEYEDKPEMTIDGQQTEQEKFLVNVNTSSDEGWYRFADFKEWMESLDLETLESPDWTELKETTVTEYTIRVLNPVEKRDYEDIDLDLSYTNPDDARIVAKNMTAYGSDEYGREFIEIDFGDNVDEAVQCVRIFSMNGVIEDIEAEYEVRVDENNKERLPCNIEIHESTMDLEAWVAEHLDEIYKSAADNNQLKPMITKEVFAQGLWFVLEDYVYVDKSVAGWWSEIYDIASFGWTTAQEPWLWYLYQEVTIPAGESVEVVVEQDKSCSFNYGNQRKANNSATWFGLEVAAGWGSNLNFSEQTAEVLLANDVVVMADNFVPDDSGVINLDEDMHYLYFLTQDAMKRRVSMPGTSDKPVIYLYPEEETEVTVKLDLDGELTSSWPKYDTDSGWQVTARPDGTIVDEEGYEYSYLFWEAELIHELDFSEGFVVKGEDSAEFFREKLSYMGLTPEEYNEFIVYWAPILEENPYNLISFQWENYEQAAGLEINPVPDSMLRVYMAYQPLDEPVKVKEQDLPVLEREGFTVVEWGGCRLEE